MTESHESLGPESPKRLNFAADLIPSIVFGKKFLTWRIGDDKDLRPGDSLELWEKWIDKDGRQIEGSRPFSKATVMEIWEKPFSQFGEKELTGHEPFGSQAEMVETYRRYYGGDVGSETVVKIVRFQLV